MKYLLDTNTCIRYLTGRSKAVIYRVRTTPAADIAVCSVVKHELYFGSRRSTKPEASRLEQDEFLMLFYSFPFDDKAADLCARIRADLAIRGTPIGVYDTMIAAIALANNLTLVTHNVREFSRVTDLPLDDWEESGENEP